MKVNATKSWLFLTLISTAGLCVSRSARADDSELSRANAAIDKAKVMIQTIQSEQQPSPNPHVNNPFGRAGTAFFVNGRPVANAAAAIRKAAEAVRDAKSDDEKSAAQKKLAEVLSKSYDDDMVQREHELKQIEERLAKLRELLERRRAKKEEVIELQTKVALNEAEGLGFYDNERPAKSGGFGYSPQFSVDAAGGIPVGGTISVSTSGEVPAPSTPPSPPAKPARPAPKAAPH